MKRPYSGAAAALLMSLLGVLPGVVHTEGMDAGASAEKIGSEVRAALDARVRAIQEDDKAYQVAMEEGRARTVLCRTCHGKDGKSRKAGVPSLAGQNAAYIVDQLQRFADGRREDYLMSSLAEGFTLDDSLQIALYFSNLPEKSFGGGRTDLIPQGKQLYLERCASCHGEDGRSEQGYALLAGQRPDYTEKMMRVFKEQTGARVNPWMTAVSEGLSGVEIKAISAYLGSL